MLLTFFAVVASGPSPFLPPLLQFTNGTVVATPAAWRERRVEVSTLAQTTFLGTIPDPAPLTSHTILNSTAAGDGVACTFVELVFDVSAGGTAGATVAMVVEIIAATDSTVRPVFMTQWNHRQWALEGVSRGYIGVMYPGADGKDVAPLFQHAYPKSTFALIAARAYVASRCLDYLLAHWPNVNAEQIAVSGHSRNGKQSLIFAAMDERVTAVVGSSPGAPIAAPYRFTSSNFYGEGPLTGGVTCSGSKWWLCSSMQYAGHPENMPMDGHGVVGLIAPRFAAIATGHQDQASDMIFAGEMNIKAALEPYKLLGKPDNLRHIYRYGQHHGFVDISTYFDWFDHAFGRENKYGAALLARGSYTADQQLAFQQQWLTAAGFDWELWNASVSFDRTPPPASAPLADRIKWALAIGPQKTSGGAGGELAAFSMGATYAEESEGSSYIPGMMGHTVSSSQHLNQQPFSFGDYYSAQAYWPRDMAVSADKPQPLVIWLHPYSYNTGYTPTYGQSKAWADIAAAGHVVMAYDQVGFGIRNTQGGNRFYARHGADGSLLGQMVKDLRAAVDFMTCRSALRANATMCSAHGYATSNAAIDAIPYIDLERIYVVGYSMGANVALHAAALDDRIKAVGSMAGFTPMRTDTADKPTGGLRRLTEMHALVPRLGLFVDNPSHVPYDYDEILSAIAPRPTLLYSPTGDRDATAADVASCAKGAAAAWAKDGAASKLTVHTPDAVTKMGLTETNAAIAWLKSL